MGALSLWIAATDVYSDIHRDDDGVQPFCGSAYDVALIKRNGDMGGEQPGNQDAIDRDCIDRSNRIMVGAGALGAISAVSAFVALRAFARRRKHPPAVFLAGGTLLGVLVVIPALMVAGWAPIGEPVHPRPAPTSRTATPAPSDPFESWTMSPDSFGPITTDMTKDQIVATGAFRVAPTACASGRLDWHSQAYESVGGDSDGDNAPDRAKKAPFRASISLGTNGRPEFIDPGTGTRTDAGMRNGDSLKQLQAAYPGRLVIDEQRERGKLGATEDSYAVSGKRSHLVFYLYKGKLEAFYLAPGAVQPGHFNAAMRGISC